MTKADNSLALLPNGFADVLPPFATGEAKSIHTLMQTFDKFGYRRIKPPMLEFEDSLFARGPGEHMAQNTFRVMDPVTHRMLGIRSDITAQISRIASSRLKSEMRPLRLAYANDVLRTKSSQIRTERQFTQVGCEVIGEQENVVQADIEMCVLPLIGLDALSLKGLTIDLTVPGFLALLLGEQTLSSDDVDAIKQAVERRDQDTLLAMDAPVAQKIAKAMAMSGGWAKSLGNVDDFTAFGQAAAAKIEHLKAVCTGVEAALDELGLSGVSITIDLFEQRGFDYHKGIAFTLFSADIKGELGRGGCYDIGCLSENGESETARGFTLYMDTISPHVADFSDKKIVCVSASAGWTVLRDLQAQGWTTVRVSGDEKPEGCTHVYENGKVKEI